MNNLVFEFLADEIKNIEKIEFLCGIKMVLITILSVLLYNFITIDVWSVVFIWVVLYALILITMKTKLKPYQDKFEKALKNQGFNQIDNTNIFLKDNKLYYLKKNDFKWFMIEKSINNL